MKKSIFLLFTLLTTHTAYANAYADDYYAKNFQSPSKNIVCMGDSLDQDHRSSENNGVSCYIFKHQHQRKQTANEQSCELDWTDGYNVQKNTKAKYNGTCHGDVFWNVNAKVLPYGQTVKGNGWQCTSLKTGMKCTNLKGSGFHINQSSYKMW